MSEKEEGKIIDEFLERFKSEKNVLLMYLGDFNEPEILEIRDILVELNIIKNQENKYYLDNYVYLTKKGKIICEKGWYNYNKEISNKNNELENIENERQVLKDKIDEFTFSKLKYEETITNLKEELMISSLLKNYWYLIGMAIGLGITRGGYLF
jgi:hypothetical protein